MKNDFNFALPCIQCQTNIRVAAIFDILGGNNRSFSCPFCGSENWIEFGSGSDKESLAIGSLDGFSSGFGSSFEKKAQVQLPGLKTQMITEHLKNGLQIEFQNLKWFLKSDLVLVQALLMDSDDTYVYYDYSVDLIKMARIRLHKKRGLIELIESYSPDEKSYYHRFSKDFIKQFSDQNEAPLFLQWLGEKL